MSETWFKEFCPQCRAVNWVYDSGREMSEDISAIQCRSCKHRWWTAEELGEEECAALIGIEVENLSAQLAADPEDQEFNMVVGSERPS